MTYNNKPFYGKTNHQPDTEEGADIGDVDHRLTPAMLVEEVHVNPAEPDHSESQQEADVCQSQRRQIDTRWLSLQMCHCEHQERQHITCQQSKYTPGYKAILYMELPHHYLNGLQVSCDNNL